MTIAACYLSTEGVVLGADSTTTIFVPSPANLGGSDHYYNFAQKIFEIGEQSTVGLVTWGLGSIGETSYRTLIAEVADVIKAQDCASLEGVCSTWCSHFWVAYTRVFEQIMIRARALSGKTDRSPEEQWELDRLWNTLTGGFCIGGRWGASRKPAAYEIAFNPLMTSTPIPQPIAAGNAKFWGWENMIQRVVCGIDARLFSAILSSGKWNGSQDELFALVQASMLSQPMDLPLREAVDWVWASIYTTIKAMKFSHLAPVCGGPIEIAVVTSDRPFRWVRHKGLADAID